MSDIRLFHDIMFFSVATLDLFYSAFNIFYLSIYFILFLCLFSWKHVIPELSTWGQNAETDSKKQPCTRQQDKSRLCFIFVVVTTKKKQPQPDVRSWLP